MRRSWYGIIFIGILLASCAAPKPGQTPIPSPAVETAAPSPTAAPTGTLPVSVEERAELLLGFMTLDEKIGQMTQVEKNSILPGDITKYFIGSILSGGGGAPYDNTPAGWVEMISGFQDEALATRLKIPIIYGVDAVHGHNNLYGATIFPQEIGLGAANDPDLMERIGRATAEEMLATGAVWNFAPVVAVPQDIRWGRTYEAYGEETSLVTELGAAYIRGLQALPDGYPAAGGETIRVLATPKHFLGDGGTTFGTSTVYRIDQGDMRADEATVRELFLPPYRAAVEAGAMSVMVSFSSWNGTKMHAQKMWITDVLKGELGFTGFVVSDWGGIDQIVPGDYYKSVVAAVNAGVDMNMVPSNYVRFIDTMKQAVGKGDIPPARIDDAVRRILRVKLMLGLFSHPYPDASLQSAIRAPEHLALAREAVRKSLVLLGNREGALPLAKDAPLILVAGEGADDIGMQSGGWTMEWQGRLGDITAGTTLLDGIRETVAAGTAVKYNRFGKFEERAPFGIVVVGEQPYAEGKGDSADLELSAADVSAITRMRAQVDRLVVVIISGRPLVITGQLSMADAWVAAWLPGSEGGGVADVLFGDYPFTGKSPYTWPRTNAQLPINTRNSAGAAGCAAPLFPFGYGLRIGEPVPALAECS
jgi:beta-glucosidase